tara:strand:- start:174 stop:392 length:219 start_codon:yes stop_codon:yes gene_type:complete
MITLNNLSIEEVKTLFSALDFYHGMYPDNNHYREQVERIESLLAMLQSAIEENETPIEDNQVSMQFCQYGAK